MFARLAPVFVALFAVVGAVAAATYSCSTVCCKSAGNTPRGWQGSGCTLVASDGTCAYTKLCCNDVFDTSAARCMLPIEN